MSNENMENQEVIATESEAVNTEVAGTETPAETNKTSLKCPHCNGEFVLETPAPQRRGQLSGLALDKMTDEQLKVEIINAKSVLYKAQKRGASADTIAKNQARVDAAVAEKEKRNPVAEAAPVAEATTEAVPVADESVYTEGEAKTEESEATSAEF